MINAIAIDDEPLALQVLLLHAEKINFLHLENIFTSPVEGMDYLKRQRVSLVFLDIKMHDISGIELAEMLPAYTKVIFTTAFENYAVKGFELNAVDYLLKPVTFSRFLKACHKAKDIASDAHKDETIMIKDSAQIIPMKLSDIYFVEATGNYLKVHTVTGDFLHRQTMKEFEEILPSQTFIRCHKSYIVNQQQITRIEPYQFTVDNQKIPISPNYKEGVWKKLGISK